jgi:hypothetical protein
MLTKNINVGFDKETWLLLEQAHPVNKNKFIREAVKEKAKKELQAKLVQCYKSRKNDSLVNEWKEVEHENWPD